MYWIKNSLSSLSRMQYAGHKNCFLRIEMNWREVIVCDAVTSRVVFRLSIDHTCDTFSTTTRTSLVGCKGENDNKLAMLARMLALFGKSQYRSRYDRLGARCMLLLSFWHEPRLALVDVVGTEESGERMPSSGDFSSLPSNCTVSARPRPQL